jgi:hypothetical protein
MSRVSGVPSIPAFSPNGIPVPVVTDGKMTSLYRVPATAMHKQPERMMVPGMVMRRRESLFIRLSPGSDKINHDQTSVKRVANIVAHGREIP